MKTTPGKKKENTEEKVTLSYTPQTSYQGKLTIAGPRAGDDIDYIPPLAEITFVAVDR